MVRQKSHFSDFDRILRFSNRKCHNSDAIKSFGAPKKKRYSNFEAQNPMETEKIKLSYEAGLGKCENSPRLVFGRNIQICASEGGLKIEVWGSKSKNIKCVGSKIIKYDILYPF